ncbi:phage adaptor protein [Pseudochrobactrum kiredjianiae]|uniref:Phage tail protein n=1 Tax=Pseudochrobactrum kiredjianiae TaxID=386305 RepID=A0ABW3UZV0_9HYPH|nr:hypothetical protein [Pseudochrobactrum kiredjianiae]MDM7852364.1 hypothetical protein [Pseudochrobactrum kiredjianiae]
MAITVATSGPNFTGGDYTFPQLIADISRDIDDDTGEYTADIQRAVAASIRYCERETYYFNETRDVTFKTVAGQQWYGVTAHEQIPRLVHIQAAFREDTAGHVSDLRREMPEDTELVSDRYGAKGLPVAFTYFNQQLRLYPVPDGAYKIRLQLGAYRLAPLTSFEIPNAWVTEAYDLIKARAKYILAKDTLKDPQVATEALSDYQDQHKALKRETTSRSARGVIRATAF